MPNLRFLKVYKSKDDRNDRIHISEEMELPRRLRLLHWKAYPSKSLPLRFCLENLVELNMQGSQLEKLWEGTQLLTNLKKMDLSWSLNLKELPDLSNAAMLKTLNLRGCESLVEIHSSVGNLHRIDNLDMGYCKKLQVAKLSRNFACVDMEVCPQLRNFPDVFTNIRVLTIADTMLEELAKNFRHWSAIKILTIYGDNVNIERIPDCIKDFRGLGSLYIVGCLKLASLPELPASLTKIVLVYCISLKTVSLDFDYPEKDYLRSFSSCFKLGREARRVLELSAWACLPGRKIPAEFDHRAPGNSLTICSDVRKFRICLVVSPKQDIEEIYIESPQEFLCRVRINKGCLTDYNTSMPLFEIQAEHLCIFYTELVGEDGWLEQDNEIMLEFITIRQEFDIIECGVQTMTEESERRRRIEFDEANKASQESLNSELTDGLICDCKEDNSGEAENHTDCWSWLFLCLDLSDFLTSTASLFWGRRP